MFTTAGISTATKRVIYMTRLSVSTTLGSAPHLYPSGIPRFSYYIYDFRYIREKGVPPRSLAFFSIFINQSPSLAKGFTMPRKPRVAPGGYCYHVFNRANARHPIFFDEHDNQMFIRVVKKGLTLFPIEIYAWCLMPNHWHFVVRPQGDGTLSKFFGWITNTHTQRYRNMHKNWGGGSLYCGRFRSEIITEEVRLPIVCRYVERNPLAADLVTDARKWPWSSMGQDRCKHGLHLPVASLAERDRPGWINWVNEPFLTKELVQSLTIGKDRESNGLRNLPLGG